MLHTGTVRTGELQKRIIQQARYTTILFTILTSTTTKDFQAWEIRFSPNTSPRTDRFRTISMSRRKPISTTGNSTIMVARSDTAIIPYHPRKNSFTGNTGNRRKDRNVRFDPQLVRNWIDACYGKLVWHVIWHNAKTSASTNRRFFVEVSLIGK